MPLPHLTRSAPWFAFLGHFRGSEDMYRTGGSDFLLRYSASDADFRGKMTSFPPLVIGEFLFGSSTSMRGELIAIARSPEQMVGSDAFGMVRQAVDLAIRRGARVIGLGALTSPVSGGGLKLIRGIPRGVTLTNGNGYTAAVVRRNVGEAVKALGRSRARVAIIGCTGSVGVAACHLLAEDGHDLILIGRSMAKVRSRIRGLSVQSIYADTLQAARAADVVLLLTSDPSALLTPTHIGQGAVVIDVAQPQNVDHCRVADFHRQGNAVVEGGTVIIPAYVSTFDFGVSGGHAAHACLAETYLFAREGIQQHSVGRPSPAFARSMESVAMRHGVFPASLFTTERQEVVALA